MIFDPTTGEWVDGPYDEPDDLLQRGPIPVGDAMGEALLHAFDVWSGVVDRDPDAMAFGYANDRNGPHWRQTRDRARQRAGGRCQGCGRSGHWLEVHHMTYNRLGREAESDLIALCPDCHRTVHGR